MKRISIIVPVCVLIAGCGGGSGGGTVTPSATYRTNQIGDSWTYNAKLDLGIFGTYIGTLDEGLTSDTYNGAASIKSTRNFTFPHFQGGPAYINSYSELSTNGTLLAEQINGNLDPIANDTFSVPTPLTATTTATGALQFFDGTTISENYKVVGTAVVATKLGGFACWVINQTTQWSTGASDDYTIWYAPQIGNYAKIEDTTINPDGSYYKYTATLASMVTVAPSATARAAPSGQQLGENALSTRISAPKIGR